MKVVEPSRWTEQMKHSTDYTLPDECRGGMVIDCGCNVGSFEFNYPDRFDSYVCYDVVDENIEIFKNNMKDVDINFVVEKRACSDVPGVMVPVYAHQTDNTTGTDYYGNSGNVSTILYVNPDGEWGWTEENKIDEVQSVTIEEIYDTYKDFNIKLLKIDIEGGEYKFLMNKDLTGIEYITGEFHFLGEDFISESNEILKNNNKELIDYISKTHDIINLNGIVYLFKLKQEK